MAVAAIKRLLDSPRFNFVGAVLSVIAEVTGWLANVPDTSLWSRAAFGLTVVFLGRLAWTQYWDAEALRNSTAPKVSLVFNEGQLFNSLHRGGELRIFRVGVLNSGLEPVANVAIKVARIHPVLPRVFPMQELQQTHQPDGVSRFTVNKSTEPLVFVDVIWQFLYQEDGVSRGAVGNTPYEKRFKKGETRKLNFKFAGMGETDFKPLGAHPTEPYKDHYLIWLAIDGAGAEESQKFILQRNAGGQFEMKKTIYN
jgi:hypothetical protein